MKLTGNIGNMLRNNICDYEEDPEVSPWRSSALSEFYLYIWLQSLTLLLAINILTKSELHATDWLVATSVHLPGIRYLLFVTLTSVGF